MLKTFFAQCGCCNCLIFSKCEVVKCPECGDIVCVDCMTDEGCCKACYYEALRECEVEW